jgi:septal ring factor EnvC (AmiA/AmiB activator)
VFRPERRRSSAARATGWRIAAGLALALAGAPVTAQDRDGGSATELERQAEEDRERAKELREKAADVRQEVRALRSESVTVAKRAQRLEAELSKVETTLADLNARASAKRAALRDRRKQLADTLAALQRIAIQPPEALAMSSRSPLEVLRGAMVLGETVPAIEKRARHLRGDLVELRQLREKIGKQRETLERTKQKLASKREQLSELVKRKKQLRDKLVGQSKAAAQRADQLADKAESMRDLVAKLRAQSDREPPSRGDASPDRDGDEATDEAAAARSGADRSGAQATARHDGGAGRRGDVPPRPEPKPANLAGNGQGPDLDQQTAKLTRPEDIRAFPDSRESLRMPASGEVVTRYGEKIERAGGRTAAKGIVIKTRHGARVVAPYDGKVAYAGPFKGYGRILIIEHGNRYHSLLAGLDRIDAVVGQWVLAGEPVGVMSQGPARTPELYMELRRTGRPINPLPWLAQTGNKVKG